MILAMVFVTLALLAILLALAALFKISENRMWVNAVIVVTGVICGLAANTIVQWIMQIE